MSYESYGVIRCARNVRRRREARARFVRRVAWALLALGIVLALSGCEARAEVDRALIGVVLGLSTFLLVGLVWMAATEQARQDRLGEAYEEAEENEECRMPNAECEMRLESLAEILNDECRTVRVGLEDVREIVGACRMESREVMLLVDCAQQAVLQSQVDESLRLAQKKLAQVTRTLSALRRSLEPGNLDARRAGA